MARKGISFEVDKKSIRKIERELKRQTKKTISNLQGKIDANVIFTPQFMQKYTDAKDLTEFINNSEIVPFDIDTRRREIDKYVRLHSRFNSWEEMLVRAYTEKRLH